MKKIEKLKEFNQLLNETKTRLETKLFVENNGTKHKSKAVLQKSL